MRYRKWIVAFGVALLFSLGIVPLGYANAPLPSLTEISTYANSDKKIEEKTIGTIYFKYAGLDPSSIQATSSNPKTLAVLTVHAKDKHSSPEHGDGGALLVQGNKLGSATVTIEGISYSGTRISVTHKVKIVKRSPQSYLVTSSYGKGTLRLPRGASVPLSLNALTENSIGYDMTSWVSKSLKWSSSNKKVATVDKKGKVKVALKARVGKTATITGKGSGKTVSVKIKVVQASKKSKLQVLSKGGTVRVGSTRALSFRGKGRSAKVTFHSSNTGVATVSKSGLLTVKRPGTAVIKVTSGKTTRKIKFTSKPPRRYFLDEVQTVVRN